MSSQPLPTKSILKKRPRDAEVDAEAQEPEGKKQRLTTTTSPSVVVFGKERARTFTLEATPTSLMALRTSSNVADVKPETEPYEPFAAQILDRLLHALEQDKDAPDAHQTTGKRLLCEYEDKHAAIVEGERMATATFTASIKQALDTQLDDLIERMAARLEHLAAAPTQPQFVLRDKWAHRANAFEWNTPNDDEAYSEDCLTRISDVVVQRFLIKRFRKGVNGLDATQDTLQRLIRIRNKLLPCIFSSC